MRRLSLVQSTALTTLFCAGILAGCGDNLAKVSQTGTGGSGAGGTGGAGGAGGAGGVNPTTCPTVSFVTPTTGTMWVAADDSSGMSCAGGFKHNVTVSVSAANGTIVELHGAVVPGATTSPPLLATGTVTGSQVVFAAVQFPEGLTTLSVQIGGVACTPTSAVTVDCNLPTCAISAPTHDTLNGVAAPAGDRVSSLGSDYQAAFAVTTDIEDGQPVVLSINNAATPTGTPVTVTANAQSGRATFAGVTFKPDGQYLVSATCTNKANKVGHSMSATFTVDTTPPVVTVDQPMSGASFAPADLTNGAFKVCATTTSTDAVNLPASGSVSASNLCVTRGQSTGCTPVLAVGTSTCINVVCPNGAPFDLTVSLFDAAGNPTSTMLTGISCTSTLPAVQIVAPLTDAPNFLDASKRLLAASSSQTLKDADGVTAGAQTTVVACTDTMGASAQLLVGHRGDATLTALGAPITVVAAVAADNCPNSLGFVAKFVGVTLPESTEAADGTLTAATEIRVDVADPTTATAVGTSGPTDLWVDSTNPTLSEKTPTPLCGSTQTPQSPLTSFTSDVDLNSTTSVVAMTVTNGMTTMFGPPTYVTGTPAGVATFASVVFPQGVNVLNVTATEPSGNTASLTPPTPMLTCTVTVGTAPVVTFTAPVSGQNLCASDNTSTTCIPDATPGAGAAAGWQGNINVHVTSGGAPLTTGNITFTIAGGAPMTAPLDAMGNATLTAATITEGAAVVLTATTANIPGQGVGTNSITVKVDTLPPAAASGLMATVLNRRETSFTLTWTAPADAGGGAVAGYQIRYAKVPITAANFDTATVTTAVTFGGSAGVMGHIETITVPGLYIENDYYFAVVAVDALGNKGALIATATATAAHFNLKVLTPPAGGPATERFSYSVDGVSDVNGDGKSDILVGSFLGLPTGQNTYIFYGSSTFDLVTAPSVIITGPAVSGFGRQFVNIGDIDGDTREDYALSAQAGNGPIFIFKGRAVWNPAYTAVTEADYVINLGAAYAGSSLGATITRLGDFNGDNVDDFAVGASGFGGGRGRVVVILGEVGFSAATVKTDIIDGDPTAPTGTFGASVLGMGRFFANTAGTTLAVAAPVAGGTNRGRVYVFQGIPGAGGGTITAAMANNFIEGPVDNAFYGTTLSLAPPVAGVPGLAIGAGRAIPAGNGVVDVYYGTTTTGPFVNPPVRFVDSKATAGTDLFGRLIIGGHPGTSIASSVIGGILSGPDLIMAPFQESAGGPARVYLVDGARLSSIVGPIDVATLADAIVPLPLDWRGVPLQRTGLIRDLDGDGYADFAVGENSATSAGRLAVFW